MKKLILMLVVSILLLASNAHASLISSPDFVYLDQSGREWIDLNEIAGFSWAGIANVCDHVSGDCSGTLDRSDSFRPYSTDLDLTGITWASDQDVEELFYEVGELPDGSLDDGVADFPASGNKGDLFASVFNPTSEFPFGTELTQIFDGYTRNLRVDPVQGLVAGRGVVFDNAAGGLDIFDIGRTWGNINARNIEAGTWAYRVATPIPAPAVIWLLGIGLSLSIGFRHKKHKG
jgi:hypothetical protein